MKLYRPLIGLALLVFLVACLPPTTPTPIPITDTVAPPTVSPAVTATLSPLPPTSAPPSQTPTGHTWGVQTKTSGCISAGALTDPACTPGDIFTNATVQQICTPGYSSSVRNVPQSEKDQAFAEYGVTTHTALTYEVDHLVPLELGGSNTIANLWPESAEPRPGFHEKDQVENYLHDQMCAGKIDLTTAQIEIATNWLAVYQQIKAP